MRSLHARKVSLWRYQRRTVCLCCSMTLYRARLELPMQVGGGQHAELLLQLLRLYVKNLVLILPIFMSELVPPLVPAAMKFQKMSESSSWGNVLSTNNLRKNTSASLLPTLLSLKQCNYREKPVCG